MLYRFLYYEYEIGRRFLAKTPWCSDKTQLDKIGELYYNGYALKLETTNYKETISYSTETDDYATRLENCLNDL